MQVHQDATWYLGPGHALDGDPTPPQKRATAPPPMFGPCLLWPNDWKVEGLEKRLDVGLARSQSHLVAIIRRLGLVELQEGLGLGLGLVSD